jgi:hypothetical protein
MYEAGASAMLEGLREKGARVPVAVKSMRWAGIVDGLRARIGNHPGYLVFIPEEAK